MAETPREEYDRCTKLAARFEQMKDLENGTISWMFAGDALAGEAEPENLDDILEAYKKAIGLAERGGANLDAKKGEAEQKRLDFLRGEIERAGDYFPDDRDEQIKYIRRIVEYSEDLGLSEVRAFGVLGGVMIRIGEANQVYRDADNKEDMEKAVGMMDSASNMLGSALESASQATTRESLRKEFTKVRGNVMNYLDKMVELKIDSELINNCLDIIEKCLEMERFDKGRLASYKAAKNYYVKASDAISQGMKTQGEEGIVRLAEAIDLLSEALDQADSIGKGDVLKRFQMICGLKQSEIEEELGKRGAI